MLFTAKYVIPVTAPFIEDGAVLVRGDEIADVGPAEFLKAKYPDEEVRDMGLSALMPGFVDVHTHLGYTALRGMFGDLPYSDWKRAVLRREVLFTPQDWIDSARLGSLEAVASGITTIADITSTGSSFVAASEIGLRARIYREVMTIHGDHADAVVQEGVDDIKAWREQDTSSRIQFGIASGPIYSCHPKVFSSIARYANENGVPVAMHLAGSHEEDDFIRYGSSPFAVHTSEHENHRLSEAYPPWLPAGVSPVKYVSNWDILDVPEVLAVQCVKLDDDDIAHLAERDVRVGVCSRANAKLGMGVAPVAKMRAAGVTVGLGTGSVAACDSLDPFEEMRFTLLMQRASNGRSGFITGPGMVKMATLDSARALRMDDQVGSLEVGKLADVIAVDLSGTRQIPTHFPNSAVIHTAHPANVLMTMIGGEVVYDATDEISPLLTMDPREIRRILANTDRARAKLRQA